MKFYWVKTTWIIRKLFPRFVWEIPSGDKVVYLTFDDGPTPEVTQWVLKQLEDFSAKATFFCIGNNISNNPAIYRKVVDSGHAIGNHTYNHVNGWKTDFDTYIDNVAKCEQFTPENKKLFRPPYGKLMRAQANSLLKMGYRIIMWDILSADFDRNITKEKCLGNVIKNIRPGSVVIFHDSVKAFPNLEYALPKTLQFLKDNGYRCDTIA